MAEELKLTIAQACRLVGASDSTLRRMIRTGVLDADRIKLQGRERVFIRRADLLAAFGRSDALPIGAGQLVRLVGQVLAPDPSQADTMPKSDDLVRFLQAELSKREHELEGLRDENRHLHERLEALNAEIKALLRAGRNGHDEPS